MKFGARNQLVGEVGEIKRGTVMGEVKLTIPAQSPMASVMTLESIRRPTALGFNGEMICPCHIPLLGLLIIWSNDIRHYRADAAARTDYPASPYTPPPKLKSLTRPFWRYT
ncbi:MAG TPA: hypothetical protein VGZ25_05200 [Gemmataceae bacterium]|jgi:hypothetical protein|nr:hypothetical protein [Gemmataceae bacterium]